MIIVDCEQRSPEWFAARAGIATASCFADILATIKSGEAASRRNYRAKLVVERLTGRCAPGGFISKAMQDGIDREAAAREAYEVQSGELVHEVGFIRHDTLECGASPDGLVGKDGCTEFKAPELSAHLSYLRLAKGCAPAQYVPQVQGQIWLAEREWCDFASYSPEFPEHLQLVVRRVFRDEVAIKSLALAVEIFMNEVREEVEQINSLELAA